MQKVNTVLKEGEEGKDQHLYKVLVIGDYAVGKTSLIKRYTEGVFSPNYRLTIGVDFALKKINYDENTDVNIQLWDIAGHERFGTMTNVYYKYAIAGIIVFDVSRENTFESVLKWREDILSKVSLANGDPIPLLLLANKCDLLKTDLDREALDQFVKEKNFIGWYAVSAQDNIGIDEAMLHLVSCILKISKTNIPEKPKGVVNVNANSNTNQVIEENEKSQCCK